MSKSKYINTFNTTVEYENYIESDYPEFPNVALDKEAGKVKINNTKPKSHVIYGELIDNYDAAPIFNINYGTNITAHIDTDNNIFYLDAEDLPSSIHSLRNMFSADISNNHKNNIKSIKKFGIDTSNITRFDNLFFQCPNLSSINLSGCVIGSTANTSSAFAILNNVLKDVYITEESTLNRLTNNLTSQGADYGYLPSSATIHYNGTDYKWQNNAWVAQS